MAVAATRSLAALLPQAELAQAERVLLVLVGALALALADVVRALAHERAHVDREALGLAPAVAGQLVAGGCAGPAIEAGRYTKHD